MQVRSVSIECRLEKALYETKMGDIIYLPNVDSSIPPILSRVYRVGFFDGNNQQDEDRWCVPIDCSGSPVHIKGIPNGILLRRDEVRLQYRLGTVSPLRHLQPGDIFEYGDLETENQWQVIPDHEPEEGKVLAICVFGVDRGWLRRFGDMNRQTQTGDNVTLSIRIEL